MVTGDACEILTIHVEPRLAGIGSALIEGVRRVAALQAQERGIRLLIEGQRRGAGPNPEY